MSKFKSTIKSVDSVYWVILLLVVILSGVLWYGYKRIESLSLETEDQRRQIGVLESVMASTTSLLTQNIETTKEELATGLEREKQNIAAVRQELGGVGSQVGAISGTVNTLEKLSKTDPELLQKYSKVFFLNEHYEPPRLSEISSKYRYFSSKLMQTHQNVRPFLEKMLDAAMSDGVEIYVYSSYRSFDTQGDLKGQYTTTYGEGANQFSADQGYSEHQLGTTVDLITIGIGGNLEGFEKTNAYQWLLNNAYKYGFILSYPENNSYYIFEPWHWRFVGVGFATYLHSTGQYFYNLEQRKIDEYLVSIFD